MNGASPDLVSTVWAARGAGAGSDRPRLIPAQPGNEYSVRLQGLRQLDRNPHGTEEVLALVAHKPRYSACSSQTHVHRLAF